jgi:hypothetical protein
MNDNPRRIQPRPNVVTSGRLSFRKRYEAVGYWLMLTIVLVLVIWFLARSAANSGEAKDAEATVVATLFVPETATAEAKAEAGIELDTGK